MLSTLAHTLVTKRGKIQINLGSNICLLRILINLDAGGAKRTLAAVALVAVALARSSARNGVICTSRSRQADAARLHKQRERREKEEREAETARLNPHTSTV